jgi:DNA invertase Pin-like site-specific DNA recombinase
MLIGYARVSTGEQNLDLQVDALKQAGCREIYTDEMSGAKTERPGLQKALTFLREGDTLVVWRLDRLGRSLKDLVQKVEDLQKRDVGFRSLQESIDTTSSVGKFQFHVFSALAEFERDLIRDRTMAGLRAARERGRRGGRRRSLTPEQVIMASKLIKTREVSIKELLNILKVSKPTLYRYVSPTGDIRNDGKTNG